MAMKQAQSWQILHTSPGQEEKHRAHKRLCVFDHACVVSERLRGSSSPQAVCSAMFSEADQSRPGPISLQLSSSHHIIVTGKPTDVHPAPPFPRRGDRKPSTMGFIGNCELDGDGASETAVQCVLWSSCCIRSKWLSRRPTEAQISTEYD